MTTERISNKMDMYINFADLQLHRLRHHGVVDVRLGVGAVPERVVLRRSMCVPQLQHKHRYIDVEQVQHKR